MKKEDAQQFGLRASLGLFDAVSVSVSAIIGGRIFVVTGIAAGVAGSVRLISMPEKGELQDFRFLKSYAYKF
jgi:amino acid transporter